LQYIYFNYLKCSAFKRKDPFSPPPPSPPTSGNGKKPGKVLFPGELGAFFLLFIRQLKLEQKMWEEKKKKETKK
jgi:hypothetical protein